MTRWLLAGSVLAIAAVSRADDSAWSKVGGAGTFSKNAQIEMVSEVVKVHLYPETSHVRATFHFQNHGNSTSVKMAFPERFQTFDHKPCILRFNSWVDGKRVKVVATKVVPDNPDNWGFHRAWVKTVDFAAHGKRTVLVEYDAVNSETNAGIQQSYIVSTGSSWRGPIKSIRVDAEWENLRGSAEPDIFITGHDSDWSPSPTSPHKHSFVWHDIKPDFDVSFWWADAFDNFFVNGEQKHLCYEGGYRNEAVTGSPQDPWIDATSLINLAGGNDLSEGEWSKASDARPLKIGSHTFQLSDREHAIVDGQRRRLKHPARRHLDQGEPNQELTSASSLNLREAITLMGGTFRYSKRYDHAYIYLPSRKAARRLPK